MTWVEHAEVEDEPLNRMFNQFVSSGIAFGAQRWLAVLQRQCERFASLMARNISDLGGTPFCFFNQKILFCHINNHAFSIPFSIF